MGLPLALRAELVRSAVVPCLFYGSETRGFTAAQLRAYDVFLGRVVRGVCEESLLALNARRAAEGRPAAPLSRFRLTLVPQGLNEKNCAARGDEQEVCLRRPNLVLQGCGRPHAEDA